GPRFDCTTVWQLGQRVRACRFFQLMTLRNQFAIQLDNSTADTDPSTKFCGRCRNSRSCPCCKPRTVFLLQTARTRSYEDFFPAFTLAQRALAARLIASLPAADSLRFLRGFFPTLLTIIEPKAAAAAPNAVSCRSNLVICVLILRCSRRIVRSICMIPPVETIYGTQGLKTMLASSES